MNGRASSSSCTGESMTQVVAASLLMSGQPFGSTGRGCSWGGRRAWDGSGALRSVGGRRGLALGPSMRSSATLHALYCQVGIEDTAAAPTRHRVWWLTPQRPALQPPRVDGAFFVLV